jgi:hypothetical protein
MTPMNELHEQIRKLAADWLEIAAGRRCFGSGTTAEQATRFQLEKLLPLTTKLCRQTLGSDLRSPADGLASLVGMSPQTTITMAEALRPRSLLLVTSENASESIQVIHEWFNRSDLGWQPPCIAVRKVPPTDSSAIAHGVRNWIADQRASSPNAILYFDATGGKKSMSVVAGMLAVQLNLEVVYLDTEFDASLRMPRPGSEVVVRVAVPNPE